ncbi:hypothetical protein D9758_016694 [Tetrapyrgos nigripes]|uniref:Glycerol-3-phosphate dehydrogenase n=1 Tax=Tetrapyrgos nigripes TaxID=182062 RepID=A0A8H5FGE4_9AGAR|nr:hypothetical protein D9758_016694 [Tetrapyrgos nigripes]
MYRVRNILTLRNIALSTGTTALVVGGGGYAYLNSGPVFEPSTLENRRPPPPWTPPTRATNLAKLAQSSSDEFDLLIVGGGATGAGVALDAASRGLKVALVERDDFSAGTSSKSTKLVHGGVRYLQKAVFELDYEQWKLVKEALHERRVFLETAPYLSSMLPIMLPIYNWYQIPYYYAGCKLYDALSSSPSNKTQHTQSSYLMSRSRALETFPMLKQQGLVGAVVYYDGQHNDSRMNIALVMTAVREGAVVANYCEVTSLEKDQQTGKVNGAIVRDTLTGNSFTVKAKGVINATGPFSDSLLKMDNPNHEGIVQASSGVHITLPNYYSPRKMGLLDPSTSDGRVIFFLPWQGFTIAGTTDAKASVTKDPVASEEEIRWVLDEVRRYLSPDIKVRRGDVLSAWSGLRPLVRNPAAADTQGLVRNHMIYVSPSGLLTIAGESGRHTLKLLGSSAWHPNMFISLIQRYGIETDVAQHLAADFGDRAWSVCEEMVEHESSLSEKGGDGVKRWPVHGKRLVDGLPYLEAEIRYVIHNEYALKPTDILARRTRLSFLNVQSALECLPRVVDIMGEELGWTYTEKRMRMREGVEFLGSMGLVGVSKATIGTSGLVGFGIREPEARGFRQRVERLGWDLVDGVWAVPVLGLGGLIGGLGLGLGLWGRSNRDSVDNRSAKEMKTGGIGTGTGTGTPTSSYSSYSRAKFEAGEMVALKSAFVQVARARGAEILTRGAETETETLTMTGTGTPTEPKIFLSDILTVLSQVSGYGYEDVKEKDVEYALGDVVLTGARGKKEKEKVKGGKGEALKGVEVDWDEFVEICGNLKEISFAPDPRQNDNSKSSRMVMASRIPVEKSGGGFKRNDTILSRLILLSLALVFLLV